MDAAVARFCSAAEAGDVPAMAATFAPGVELPSPLIGRAVFKGSKDVTVLLGAVYEMLTDVRFEPPVGDARTQLALASARVGPLRIGDAMVFELDGEGRIVRIRPHLRPLLGMILFLVMIGPRLARAPGVVVRAMRG